MNSMEDDQYQATGESPQDRESITRDINNELSKLCLMELLAILTQLRISRVMGDD